MPTLSNIANPTRFLGLSDRLLPWLIGTAFLAFAAGLYGALISSPADYQQGDSVRIMYVHVPAAWMAMFCYVFMASASIGSLVWRHPLADVAAKSAAPIGAVFTFLALVTGSIWGKPMWGTWWVWDARLTSVLVLFIMYLGLIALWRAFDDPGRAGRIAAIMTLVGAFNIPIIKFSVDWWNTLHQPASVLRFDGPTIHPSMLWPLVVMALAYMLLFSVLLLFSMRAEIYRRRLRRAQMIAAQKVGATRAVVSVPSEIGEETAKPGAAIS